jgi:hypothetical protein
MLVAAEREMVQQRADGESRRRVILITPGHGVAGELIRVI